jgi:hypothetical protein
LNLVTGAHTARAGDAPLVVERKERAGFIEDRFALCAGRIPNLRDSIGLRQVGQVLQRRTLRTLGEIQLDEIAAVSG